MDEWSRLLRVPVCFRTLPSLFLLGLRLVPGDIFDAFCHRRPCAVGDAAAAAAATAAAGLTVLLTSAEQCPSKRNISWILFIYDVPVYMLRMIGPCVYDCWPVSFPG